jgi:hypothetical protein
MYFYQQVKRNKKMKGLNMKKKHSQILSILITQIVSLLSVRRYEPISAWGHQKYASTKKLDICKSETQYFGYSSLQVAENLMTSDLIKPIESAIYFQTKIIQDVWTSDLIKSVANFQTKIGQDIWTKVSELALKHHSSFYRKSIAELGV